MAIRDIVPRFGGRNRTPERRREPYGLASFQEEMNRLFDDFFSDFGLVPSGSRAGQSDVFSPKVNVSESDSEVKISAELPGMDEKDVSVELEGNSLAIKGERTEENEDKGKNWHRREYSYGSFYRVVDLPAAVDADKAKARFKKGVLDVTLPKLSKESENRKAIDISGE
jgi:HSP20 family protein